MNRGTIRWVITVSFAIAALGHTLVPFVTFDSIAVTLLGIACVPWVGRLFAKVEIPGFLKLEGQALEEAGDRIVKSGLIPSETARNDRPGRHVYAFEAVGGDDPNIVLAGLRIELERRIRAIAESRGVADSGRSLRRVINDLARRAIIGRDEASAIADLLPLLNRAAHGATVDRAALEWALDFGPPLLDALEEHLGQASISDLLDQWRRRDGALFQEVGTKLSKALVDSPRTFLQAMANDSESFDSWIEGIQTHTFTLYESDGELEDDLYTAYYQKLKTLMEDRVRSMLDTELDKEASRVLSALLGTTIRRIW